MAKIIIHKVRKPFYCREGQFTSGKRELCIGLDLNTIQKADKFECYIGNNENIVYQIDPIEALRIGQEWRNPKGKIVLIVPLNIDKIKNKLEEVQSIGLVGTLAKIPLPDNWEATRKRLHSK